MKGALVLAALPIGLAAVPVFAEEPLKLEDENARINYSVGFQLGSDFRRQSLPIDIDLLVRGAADALADSEPLISPQDMRKELTDLQKRVAAESKAQAEQRAKEQREAGKAFLEENKTKEGVQVTESGLQYKIIVPGTGKQPGPTDTVAVNYRGTLVDGTLFDSSYKRGRPSSFRLDRVIKGWTEGLQLLKEGGRAQLFVPYELAYGDSGRLGNQALVFDVELLAVEEAKPEEQGEPSGGASQ
jgi:FKBP-type peptidyl-prolyl cis-trans isomerase